MKKSIERILREEVGVAPGDRILVAVSGGSDSVALLHLLCALASDFPFALHVAHFDHALRPQSGDDAAFVASLCRRLDLPLAVGGADVRGEAGRRGGGIEEAARFLRRRFLEEAAAENGCRWIALGHHRGDQAETVLHRILRGTSLAGLAGMRPRSGPYIRPLLECTRSEILDYLTLHGLSFVEDATNLDPKFTRNRLRHQVLPLLEEFNPRLQEHLARMGGRIAREEDFWRGLEEEALARLSCFSPGEMRLERQGLLALHPALRLRVIREGVRRVRGELEGVDAVHLEAVDALLRGGRPQAQVDLPGLWAARRYETVLLRRFPLPEGEPFRFILPAPGEIGLPDGRVFRAQVSASREGEGLCAVEFDAAAVPFPLEVRSFSPGDLFHPRGSAGRRKLKRFFIDSKIDREARRSLPLVVADEILWVVGVRRCDGRSAVEGRPILRLSVFPAPNL